jgi:predicted O-linked N-acetylglucosamine transferase (SPINDLY family)
MTPQDRAMTADEAVAYARGRLQSGDAGGAEAVVREVLGHDSDHAGAAQLLGVCLARRGAFAEALPLLESVVRAQPGHAGARNNLGNALQGLGRHDEALACFDAAIALDPRTAVLHGNRGNALKALGRHAEAIASYDAAIALAPGHPGYFHQRGAAKLELRRADDALADLDRALALDAGFAAAHLARAAALHDLRRLDEALASCDRALAAKADYALAHVKRAYLLRERNEHEAAQASLAAALALAPDLPYLLGDWVQEKQACCDWDGLAAAFARVGEAIGRGARACAPFALLAMPSSAAQQRDCARIFVADRYPEASLPAFPRVARERIRIGYFSADFHDHATSHLIAGVLERHDRARFEVTAFSFGPPSTDAWRRRVEAAVERFVDVRSLADAEVAAQARALGIDVAVDLKGHTQHARTGIFACRAAPVQASWLGYPGTLGARFFDYAIADRTLVEASDFPFYDEKIAYLPHSYQPNDTTKAIPAETPARTSLGLPAAGFVFCCFNHGFKILPDAFDAWMRLLRAVDGGVLWLLESNAAAVRNLKREAASHDVAPERLVFAPRADLASHLARHRQADLFLDTMPYNAHTTASDALWAGVPVVTCRGATFAGRVGESLLRAVGLPELVAPDLAGYESLALGLARDPARLAAVRAKLAANRASQPLFDTVRFARDVEALYAAMVARFRAGLPADHIEAGGA